MGVSVSVIVPMYNVAPFVERCARQLFEQTLENVELIFIDDCSPDNSASIVANLLESYPSRKEQVQIVRHEVNKGLPSARNTGLKIAKGEFVFHCDGDDWVETNALELLFNNANAQNADIVWCDYYLTFKDNERYMSQQAMQTSNDPLYILEQTLSGRLKYNVWNKLVKRDLYLAHDITFPDGYGMGEDMTMIQLFAVAKRVSYLPEALYHYVQLNSEAFTKKPSPKHLDDIKYNVDRVIKFLENRYASQLDDYIHYFKLNTKLPFLISADQSSYERWLSFYPESNAYIEKNPSFNFRTRFIQKAALKRQFWLIKLYYYFVIKVVYGLIYK
ncbi:glycosyltransferase [Sphingobacterium sp. DK4209]|uniref:Glycosyltransferase n=1 Tax=Sphingobacterium zhuxiongii TaxID=2662364 RepID=A0A5Q0Q8J3_9SPHI|nr:MULTISPECIES: glycosyltransferase family 2 protein [unclassified Sphingobacterium]MVZ65287.1 glycosyltransferase [Sphingobacterium sp. DK4209]QGA26377.1 glycosyltransferase [Sphingobacterium sp. dk4302]